MQIVRNIILSLLCFLPLSWEAPLPAQDSEDVVFDDQSEDEIEGRIIQFMEEFNQLADANSLQIRFSNSNLESGTYSRLLGGKVRLLTENYKTLDFRWNAFTSAEQIEIANDDHLMELMANVQQVRQAVADSINSQQAKCDAVLAFIDAERFISSQDTVYIKLYKQAERLAMIKNLAPHLEKVKAEEQAIFEKIQTCYDKAQAAVGLVPQLSERGSNLSQRYYSLKATSEAIQALEYKPVFERIKDYLIGLACVSVILLFLNMLATKLKAAKKTRELLKQQQQILRGNSVNDYPTI